MATNPISRLFGSNPFSLLQEHMLAVLETAAHVGPLFEALIEGDHARVEAAGAAISESESKADEIKNNLREHLPRSLFLPVDRRDLLEVLDLQDSIADVAEDIAELIIERRMTVPEGTGPALFEFVRNVLGQIRLGNHTLNPIRFSSRESCCQ